MMAEEQAAQEAGPTTPPPPPAPAAEEAAAGVTAEEAAANVAAELAAGNMAAEEAAANVAAEEAAASAPPPPVPVQSLIEQDGDLAHFEPHLQYRWDQYCERKAAIEEAEGSLAEFAAGYRQFGFTKESDGRITYREWLPAAAGAALVGDFNGWDGGGHQLQRGKYGVWSLSMEPGSIPHMSRVKVRIWKDDGTELGDRVPAWIHWTRPDPAVMGSSYDGIYWDPPPEERFPGFRAPHPQLREGQALRIYEAHVGMSSVEPKCASYSDFAQEVLPRIKALGYNAVQLMAVMEHSYYGSFGYHVTCPFAVSSRSGTPEEFKALVERAHELGIMVLIDVVHSHASTNVLDGINGFDMGQHENDNYFGAGDAGYHWLWDSRLYKYDNWEVQRFLLSNLRWWVEEYNCDGFRFDGVTSMLYHHHGLQMEFTGHFEQYFSPDTNVDACVYLMLASTLMQQLQGLLGLPQRPVMVAEDVSGMPTLCRPVAEGGVGFDYRLAMSIPDLWTRLLSDGRADEDWSMNEIVGTLCNRRRGIEKTVAYTECHDQSIVGSKTIAFWLMDKDMYWFMGDDGTPGKHAVIERGVALHKMLRVVTLALGGEGYLNFMGNEFGHPEWIDFPRADNEWSHEKCRRRWDLCDDGLLRYKHLERWDTAMLAVEEATGFANADHLLVSSENEPDQVIVLERNSLLFVLNFHPANEYTDYKVGVPDAGRYKVCLDSDAFEFGGAGRVVHDWAYFSEPEGVPGGEGNFNGRCASITIQTLPPRTVLVFEKMLEGVEQDTPIGDAMRSAMVKQYL